MSLIKLLTRQTIWQQQSLWVITSLCLLYQSDASQARTLLSEL